MTRPQSCKPHLVWRPLRTPPLTPGPPASRSAGLTQRDQNYPKIAGNWSTEAAAVAESESAHIIWHSSKGYRGPKMIFADLPTLNWREVCLCGSVESSMRTRGGVQPFGPQNTLSVRIGSVPLFYPLWKQWSLYVSVTDEMMGPPKWEQHLRL